MNKSKTTVTPNVQCNNGNITSVGAHVNHSTNTSYTYGGVSSASGTSTFYAGTSRNISNASSIGINASINTKKNYQACVSFERKF